MKVLVVVDYQNDFVNGVLGTKEALAIKENIKNKISKARSNGDIVVFTRDTHNEDYMCSQEGKYLPVPHCIKDTNGWKIVDGIGFEEKDFVLNKPTFGSMKLPDYLFDIMLAEMLYTQMKDIELIGVCTGICVLSNSIILKAYFPETKIIVDSNCCACVTPESHNNALLAMKVCQIDVV